VNFPTWSQEMPRPSYPTPGCRLTITPPSIIFGKDVYFIISSVETLKIDMETSLGKVEVNIGLEI